ncbi:sigma-54-dependent Fis family transcriptional regulator [Thauera sp.]|uniref:sigma-54-dependent Fis family transcriptional regulator n=1 Tax=Thauera sp. TaxID=1905334 RepID=UPI00258B615D|nr:sigma-54-dependent Fis family transcriptional regulator [Thauera sp.]
MATEHALAQPVAREYRLQRARSQFFEEGVLPEDGVPEQIVDSWVRCRDLGLDRASSEARDHADRLRLAEARDRSARLVEHASGVMEHVFEQIRASGSLVILSDARGTIVHSLGDAEFVDKASRVALQPGACWSEAARGTNAIGTTIAASAPTVVLGGEHFLDHNAFLSCTAAPILDPRGTLAGVLDVSCDQRAHQRHSLGLVRLSVQLIERRLFETEFANEILVAFHERPEYVGSLQEGLIAVTADGMVVGANSIAREWIHRRLETGTGGTFAELFRQGLGKIADRVRSSSDALVRLNLRDGSDLYVQLRSMRAHVRSAMDAPAAADGGRPAALAEAGGNRAPADKGRIVLETLATGDAGIARAVDRARRILGKDIPLLIQGESGVGKELFATAFHNSGPRASGAFVALNCAAVPESLIESELFGYVGGAFTGARKEGSIGKIQQAHGGTLFLDEIGDMPLGMQARLLRVLQERCVTPVGSLKSIPVDISLVCATHRVLRDAVARGEFREDLYYRVNSLTVALPPLRERSDIRCIVDRLLRLEAAEAGRGELSIGDDVMRFIERYAWPGNVRQLHNVIRVAVALLDPDEDEILPSHLPEDLFLADPVDDAKPSQQGPGPGMPPAVAATAGGLAALEPGARRLDQLEVELIERVMREVGGNLSAAARTLGVSRNRLYRKLGRAGARQAAGG